MKQPIRILHVEDVPSDAELVERELRHGKIDFEKLVVNNRADFEKALDDFFPDIVLCDHSLPSFDSFQALKSVRAKELSVPFILITSTMTDEFAATIMKEGAQDYILKDRLQRLPSAIQNALEKYHLETEKQKYIQLITSNEKRFRALIERSIDMTTISTEDGKILYCSPSVEKILGYPTTEFMMKTGADLIHPDDIGAYKESRQNILQTFGKYCKQQLRVLHKDGRWLWIEVTLTNMLHEPAVYGFVSNFQDITENKQAEMERQNMMNDLTQRIKDLEQFAYIISHNLRAPVANIMGISNAIQDKTLTEENKEILNHALTESVVRLDDVVNDINHILQLKREINETRDKVCFSELVDNIKISIENIIDKGDIDIQHDFSECDELISIKSYLYSIFYNLISNSIKYRQQHLPCVVRIRSKKTGNKTELIFTDNGMGIDLKKKGEQVFGLYKRFHSNIEGKGIGLFMVKTQVESIGGKIGIQSEVNKGTEFRIEFVTTV